MTIRMWSLMINVAIIGYGNLGKGVEKGLKHHQDLNCFGVFTKRDPQALKTDYASVYAFEDILNYQDEIDVCILCGSSKHDLPKQTPYLSQYFNCVDSFDMHDLVFDHFAKTDQACQLKQTTSIISVGWDPGLFSIQRALFEAVLPTGQNYTFWGAGVSQGHSQAVRKVEGVIDAVQYTIPDEAQIQAIKAHDAVGKARHKRVCYVVAEEKDHQRIEEEITNMPHYFKGQDTTVHFISAQEMEQNHQGMGHGGHVIRQGESSHEHQQMLSFDLALESNPEFTASVLIAYAKAAYQLNQKGNVGALTVLDVPISALSSLSIQKQIEKFV